AGTARLGSASRRLAAPNPDAPRQGSWSCGLPHPTKPHPCRPVLHFVPARRAASPQIDWSPAHQYGPLPSAAGFFLAKDETMAQPNKAALTAQSARAWPFEEARHLVKRLENLHDGATKPVVFETGYGPSGLPHIGTFGEVARTSMVRHAFEVLTGGRRKTRLVCFSDDMDGLRKVPDNVPNRDMLAAHIGKPLTSVPDPFGNEYPSFAAHNNARLRRFLDRFGFDYEFLSATECYKGGIFDASLMRMLEAYDEVMDIILPTLGPERRATYSPFLPISPTSGGVLQVPMLERHPKRGTVVYVDPDSGRKVETLVTGGHVKCQWKADWAMRWTA